MLRFYNPVFLVIEQLEVQTHGLHITLIAFDRNKEYLAVTIRPWNWLPANDPNKLYVKLYNWDRRLSGASGGTQIPHPCAFQYGHWAEMEKVKTLIFITKRPPSPNTNVTFQFCTVQLFLNHLYKNFGSWLMMDELLSPEAPSSHYPLKQSLLMMDLKCFPSGWSAMNYAEGSKDLVWHEISRPKLFSDDAFSILGEIGEQISISWVLMVKMQHCQPAKVLQL